MSKTISQSIEIIEKNLFSSFSLADLSEEIGKNPSYLIRAFNKYMGDTPMGYLSRRRISCSAWDLVQTDLSITEIAQDYCFSSPEAFSRAFKRYVKVSPSQYRAEKRHPHFLVSHKYDKAWQSSFAKSFKKEPVIESCEGFYITGIESLTTASQNQMETVDHSQLKNRANGFPDQIYCLFLPQDNRSAIDPLAMESSTPYSTLVGYRVEDPDKDDIDCRFVPPGDFAVFTITNPGPWVVEAYRYIYSVWLPKSDYKLGPSLDFISSPFTLSNDLTDLSASLYIPIGPCEK